MVLQDIDLLFAPSLKEGIVYQYTKWPAMFGMIRNNRAGTPCEPFFVIRLYNALFMNDGDECTLGYQAFLGELQKPRLYFGRMLTEKQFAKIQTRIVDIQQKYYLASFSKSQDCLPMWRSYSNEGNGVSIGLDAAIIAQKGFSLEECIYDRATINSIVYKLCDWAEDAGRSYSDGDMAVFYRFLYRLSYLAKNAHFDYEKEYRLCSYFESFTSKNSASFDNGTHNYDVQFEHRGNRIVSFIELEFPINVVREIWIGPTNNMELSFRSINMWLESMQLEHQIQIKRSTAPFR